MCRAPFNNGSAPIEFSENELNLRMAMAAEAGHEDIVRLMLSQGANAYNMELTSAASGGHQNIVDLMIQKGADDYNEAMETAASQGHSRTNSRESEDHFFMV